MVETEHFGGGSIIMFAGISMHTKTLIVRLQGAVDAVPYQNDILLPSCRWLYRISERTEG